MSIIIIAIGLAMDAFAVSISNSIALKKINFKVYMLFGIFFGAFQFLMPIIGYTFTGVFSSHLVKYGKMISFALLLFVGINMIVGSIHSSDTGYSKNDKEILGMKNLIFLAIATSIDALAVGCAFRLVNIPILSSSIIIGITAFIMSMLGVKVGKTLGVIVGNKAEIIGGLLLIVIAIKLLISF